MSSKGNYHLFFRPYHLCHLETPRAVAQAYFDGRAVIEPARHWINDVFAYAKRDLAAGTRIEHGIGGDEFYGLVDSIAHAGPEGVPVCALESEGHGAEAKVAILGRAYAKDEPIRLSDLTIPDSALARMLAEQAAL